MSGAYVVAVARATDTMTPDLDGVPGIDFLPACALEAVTMFPMMARACLDCAYTPGTSASRYEPTARSARECVERSHAFWCHKAEDDLGKKTHLCRGWINALAARARFQDQPA